MNQIQRKCQYNWISTILPYLWTVKFSIFIVLSQSSSHVQYFHQSDFIVPWLMRPFQRLALATCFPAIVTGHMLFSGATVTFFQNSALATHRMFSRAYPQFHIFPPLSLRLLSVFFFRACHLLHVFPRLQPMARFSRLPLPTKLFKHHFAVFQLHFSRSFHLPISPCFVIFAEWIFKISIRACSLGSGISVREKNKTSISFFISQEQDESF